MISLSGSSAEFPPCMGGCIVHKGLITLEDAVSSLYGRVYRINSMLEYACERFLPVWEGVSKKLCICHEMY